MRCFSSTLKYALYLHNLIFVVSGIFMIVFGAQMVNSLGNFTQFDEVTIITFPITFIVVGSVTFLVAFLGSWGTIRESACLMKIYAISMLILFALQMVLSIWLFVEKDTSLDFMSRLVDRIWLEHDSAHGYPMDALQLAFECCGNENYRQYGSDVPASCCGYDDRSKECAASIYELRPGCNDEFVNFWAFHIDIMRLEQSDHCPFPVGNLLCRLSFGQSHEVELVMFFLFDK